MLRGGRELWLAFFAVVREGIELVLFLVATALNSDTSQTLIGAFLGLGIAVILGWSLLEVTAHLNLKRFFLVTGILLILFAAGLVSSAVHEFNELGWIPTLKEPVYDLNAVLQQDSPLGSLLKSLFGYSVFLCLQQGKRRTTVLVAIGTLLLPQRSHHASHYSNRN